MDVISKQEASAKGLKRYFTGEPCKYGHLAEREVDRGECLECLRLREAERHRRTREVRGQKPRKPYVLPHGLKIGTRAEAKRLGEKRYFTGKKCKSGHIAERDTACGKCLACRYPSSKKWREYNDRWKARHPGRDKEVKFRYFYKIDPSTLPPKPEVCDVCHKSASRIVLDHCHELKQFRGWLCDRCNLALGYAKHDVELLYSLARYLETSETRLDMAASNAVLGFGG